VVAPALCLCTLDVEHRSVIRTLPMPTSPWRVHAKHRDQALQPPFGAGSSHATSPAASPVLDSSRRAQFRPQPEIAFFDIQEASGLRQWLRTQFIAVMYGFNPNSENGLKEQAPTQLDAFYLSATSILGPIRLRQLRVRADSCEVRLSRRFPYAASHCCCMLHSDVSSRGWHARSLDRAAEHAVVNSTLEQPCAG
jgi:Polycystin cation channel